MKALKIWIVYIFLSYSEGSAQSVKEAMAIGLPVICSKTSGAPIINSENGLICNIDKKSCYDAASYLLNNVKQRSKIGSAARLEIQSNHSNERFISVFQDILKRKGLH